VLLVECKRYSQPVEREKVMALWAKLQDVKAHKALMFATCGYQSGALEYAEAYKIATVTFTEGRFMYETRGFGAPTEPPPWVKFPRYAGIFVREEGDKILCSTLDDTDALSEWLNA